MQIKNLGRERNLWFQANLETSPPILIVSDPKTQKQEYIFGKLNKNQNFCFDLKKFIVNATIVIDTNKSVYWHKNNELHREDGPAIIWSSGDKEWYKNGVFHREAGPARIWASGQKEWYRDGERHREDGPAVVYANDYKMWFINDKQFSEQEWAKLVKAKQNAD